MVPTKVFIGGDNALVFDSYQAKTCLLYTSLVSRNQDDFFDAIALRHLGHALGPHHVVTNCFPRVFTFHERHMLVSCGMKNDRWSVRGKYLIKAVNVLDITDGTGNRDRREIRQAFLLYLIHREF